LDERVLVHNNISDPAGRGLEIVLDAPITITWYHVGWQKTSGQDGHTPIDNVAEVVPIAGVRKPIVMTEGHQDFTEYIVVNLNVHDIDATGPKDVIVDVLKEVVMDARADGGGLHRIMRVAELAVIDFFVLLKGTRDHENIVGIAA
jgi:hypothetical protein